MGRYALIFALLSLLCADIAFAGRERPLQPMVTVCARPSVHATGVVWALTNPFDQVQILEILGPARPCECIAVEQGLAETSLRLCYDDATWALIPHASPMDRCSPLKTTEPPLECPGS